MNIGIVSLGEKLNLKNANEYISKKLNFTHVSFQSIERSILQQIDVVIIFDKEGSNIRETCNYVLKLRKISHIPILYVINKISKIDRLILLKLGINGFFCSDFDLEELGLLIENFMLIKSASQKGMGKKNFRIDARNRSVILNGDSEVNLTKVEFKLLSTIYSDTTQVFSYEKLFKEVWSNKFEEQEIEPFYKKTRVANVVFHLRLKIANTGTNHEYIQTVRSIGYKFCENNSN